MGKFPVMPQTLKILNSCLKYFPIDYWQEALAMSHGFCLQIFKMPLMLCLRAAWVWLRMKHKGLERKRLLVYLLTFFIPGCLKSKNVHPQVLQVCFHSACTANSPTFTEMPPALGHAPLQPSLARFIQSKQRWLSHSSDSAAARGRQQSSGQTHPNLQPADPNTRVSALLQPFI